MVGPGRQAAAGNYDCVACVVAGCSYRQQPVQFPLESEMNSSPKTMLTAWGSVIELL